MKCLLRGTSCGYNSGYFSFLNGRAIAQAVCHRPGFDPGQSMVIVALGQVSVRVLQFSFVRTIPPAIHTSLCVHIALTGWVNGRSLETFQKTMIVRKSENTGQKSTFAFVFEVLKCKLKDINTAPSDHMPRPAVKYSIVFSTGRSLSEAVTSFVTSRIRKYAVITSDR
jgi:hypothetical protein